VNWILGIGQHLGDMAGRIHAINKRLENFNKKLERISKNSGG
jgi:hypothetical protein